MDIDKIIGAEQVVYQSEDGEQKVYVLPNEEAVDQLLAKLFEGGVSDTIQLPLSSLKKESKQHDVLLDDIANRLRTITETPTESPFFRTMEEIETLLGEEYLAIDGEQKVYVLPENVAVEKLLGSFKGMRTGEIKQSQMWRKTDSNNQNDIIEAMDKRIRQLECLLNQVGGQQTPTKDK